MVEYQSRETREETLRGFHYFASSRLQTQGVTYSLALAKADSGRQRVGIVSVARDGNIRIEKELSDTLDRAEATRDIKTAKAALSARLTRQ
jgi:hypothetical protein